MKKIVINRYENSWQGFQFAKITPGELDKVDIEEIRAVMDEDSS
ncbi:MAG TPA: hypothetical protein VLA77_03500 [Candidatus Saccharimonadales bacterium]|nr:hypothetical protein [Candidatus Saccharimonadales bacterium]